MSACEKCGARKKTRKKKTGFLCDGVGHHTNVNIISCEEKRFSFISFVFNDAMTPQVCLSDIMHRVVFP